MVEKVVLVLTKTINRLFPVHNQVRAFKNNKNISYSEIILFIREFNIKFMKVFIFIALLFQLYMLWLVKFTKTFLTFALFAKWVQQLMFVVVEYLIYDWKENFE